MLIPAMPSLGNKVISRYLGFTFQTIKKHLPSELHTDSVRVGIQPGSKNRLTCQNLCGLVVTMRNRWFHRHIRDAKICPGFPLSISCY